MKHTPHTRAVRFLSGLFYFFSIFMLIALPAHLHSQWIPQSIPVNKPIMGIDFVNDSKGWAISYNTLTSDTAYIIGTTDGGTSWNIQYRGDIGLYCINAIDNNTCYAGGADTNGFSVFLKTTNGGLNWESLNVSSLLIMTEIFFLNKDTGYACDEFFGGVRLTTNGGSNWINRDNGINISQPRTLFFLNYDTGFCGGSFSLFKTTNGGINWNQLIQLGEQVMDIQFNNGNLGWVALTGNTIGITSNGGLNWSFSNPAKIAGGTVPSICFVTDSIGWCGTRTQRIFKTTNGGVNWVTQIDSSASFVIHFSNKLTGWSGDYGISNTTNGGLTYISGINTDVPNSFKLYQNYPNPFNPSTNIRFAITKYSEVRISIFDLLGREILNGNSNESLKPGIYEYLFTGENLSSGVYIYRLTAKSSEGSQVYSDSRKMIFLK